MLMINADAILGMMKPGRIYKPATIAAHFQVGTASVKHVLIELEGAGRLQSVVHINLRHWRLPVATVAPIQIDPKRRPVFSTMPNYSRVQEQIAEYRAIPSKHA